MSKYRIVKQAHTTVTGDFPFRYSVQQKDFFGWSERDYWYDEKSARNQLNSLVRVDTTKDEVIYEIEV